MSYQLFLDDVRVPSSVKWVEIPLGPWEIVRSYNAFVNIITKRGLPTFISFDHDLAECDQNVHGKPYSEYKEKTGFHCAQWLVEYCLNNKLSCPDFTVHSMNPVGAENIRSLLRNFMLNNPHQ